MHDSDVEGRKPVDGIVGVRDAKVRVGRRGQWVGVREIEAREWREEHLIGDVGVLLTCAVLLEAVPTVGGLGGSLGGGGDGNGHTVRGTGRLGARHVHM